MLDTTDFVVSVSNATTLGQPDAHSYSAPWLLQSQRNTIIQGFDKQDIWESDNTKLNYLETWSFVATSSHGLAGASNWVVDIKPSGAQGTPPLPEVAWVSLGNFTYEVKREGGSYTIPLSWWDNSWWSKGNDNQAFQLSVSPYDDASTGRELLVQHSFCKSPVCS